MTKLPESRSRLPEFIDVGEAHEVCQFQNGQWSLRVKQGDDRAHLRYLNEHEIHLLKAGFAAARSETPQQHYKRGDPVLVAYESGHLEECVVEETVVWVKDATGHAHECRLGQLSPINANRQGEAK